MIQHERWRGSGRRVGRDPRGAHQGAWMTPAPIGPRRTMIQDERAPDLGFNGAATRRDRHRPGGEPLAGC